MKKMFNKKFFLILGSTITFLIVLAVAMFFLTKENIKTFNREGYIIASKNEESSIKYYFDEGTSYKKNINSQLVFTDTSGEKVKVETDNFIHYIDGGIRFLKNGVIMDLDNVDSTIVPYYNITNKSVLEYTKKSYFIETVDKTLAFNNIVGRISENKYIFAGVNIKLQLAGNDKLIEGDYFEVNFIENGIIKVENQEVSYQTTAQNSFILVDDTIKINLGNKKIYYNDEEKMSLSQMTIDGNENIEIIADEKEEEGNGNGEGNQNGNENNQGNNNNENNNLPGNENGNQNGGANGNQTDETNSGQTRKASIDIVKASVGVNNISASFILNDPDNSIKGNLVLHITNTNTGKRVYSIVVDKSQKEFNIGVSTLSPDNNYILSINEENNGKYDTQYFQKLFRTDELGISLDKKYITSDSIVYEVNFEDETKIKSVRVSLYDEDYKEVKQSIIATKDDNLISFGELASNKTYNLVLDNVILDNLEYNDTYKIYKSVKTLKKTPYLSGLSSEIDDLSNVFTIGIDNVLDEDNSITKYSYYIYKADDINIDNIDSLTAVHVIDKNDASKVKVSIDNDKIFAKTNYKFKVVAEYYDNEKYMEYETELSDNFILTGKPYVEFEVDKDKTTFNKLVGDITIKDENCTVPINGRSCSSIIDYSNNFIIEYQVVNSSEKKIINGIKFNPETLKYRMEVDSLVANSEYVFNVYGDVDLLDGKGLRKGYLIGTFRANTSGVDILTVDSWLPNDSSIDDLINVSAKIVSKSNNDTIANSLNNLTFNLYAGNVKSDLENGVSITPIATKTVSGELKETYYNSLFTVNTLDTFGFRDEEVITEEGVSVTRAIDLLKEYTNGQLEKNYTIELTDAFDYGYQNEILIENNIYVFTTPPTIRIEENEINPTINADPIYNIDLDNIKELDDSTIVGYKVDVRVNTNTLEKYFTDVKELIYYVCDASLNENCTIDTAIDKKIVNLHDTDNTEVVFNIENGTKYDVIDTKLTRGHNYIFKAKFNVSYEKISNDGKAVNIDAIYPTKDIKTSIKETPKQSPTYSIYISKTTEHEVSYKYSFTDIDNALYDNKFYYVVDEGEEKIVDFSSDEFVIDNLENDSVYEISFKKALIKESNSILKVNVGKYIFDGKYAYSQDTINFLNVTYESDNRLRVLILDNETNKHLINRVAAYQITLSASGVNDYVRVYPSDKLDICTYDNKEYSCIIVDYANIKEFKSKETTVKITAYYDSGIINNDFIKLSKSTYGYILQNNNIYNPDKSKGNYIHILETKGITTSKIPIGMYEYLGNTKDMLQIKRKIDLKNFVFNTKNISDVQPSISYANDGILLVDVGGNYQTINNKLLSKVDLGSSNNKFIFNSYIPKISVSSSGLVNGASVTITPYGIDEEILNNEFKNEDGKHYFYLKIYKDEEKTEFYREEKVEIDPVKTTIELTKYMPDTTYYFEVYAYMLKNSEYKSTLLFDASKNNEYVSSVYSFSSLKPEEIFRTSSQIVKTTSSFENYAKRDLELTVKTKKNIGDYDIRFEIYDINDNLVLTETTTPNSTDQSADVSKVIKDITDMDFVFGANYYTLKIYIETSVYDSTDNVDLKIHESKINLNSLKEPTILVTKHEKVDSLSFDITIKDDDRVIKNGKYCVELLDASNKAIPGISPICDLSALDLNKTITFNGLTSDTLYIFRAYADIYTNNVNEENKERTIESRTVLSTSTDYEVALGSVAAYGSNSSVTLSFSSGVNITNIKKIDYTLMKTGGEEVKSETYIMGVNKNFELDGTNVRLVINPEGLVLQKSSSYYIVMTFWVEKNGELLRLNDRNYQYSIEF